MASERTPARSAVPVAAATAGRSRHSSAAVVAASGVSRTLSRAGTTERRSAVRGWSRDCSSRWASVPAASHGVCGERTQPSSSIAQRRSSGALRNRAPRPVTDHSSPPVSLPGEGSGSPDATRSAWRASSSASVVSSVVRPDCFAIREISRTPTPPAVSGCSGAVPAAVSSSATILTVSTTRATAEPSACAVGSTGAGTVKSPPGGGTIRSSTAAPTRGESRAVCSSTRSSRPAPIIRDSGRSGSSRVLEWPMPPAVASVSSSRRCRSGSSARTPGRSAVGTGHR